MQWGGVQLCTAVLSKLLPLVVQCIVCCHACAAWQLYPRCHCSHHAIRILYCIKLQQLCTGRPAQYSCFVLCTSGLPMVTLQLGKCFAAGSCLSQLAVGGFGFGV
jgi:hypothetical protein